MTKARQEATIRKIERSVEKLLPKPDDSGIPVGGYDDEMGDNIQDLESEPEGEGQENQGGKSGDEGNQGGENQGGEENQAGENQSTENR